MRSTTDQSSRELESEKLHTYMSEQMASTNIGMTKQNSLLGVKVKLSWKQAAEKH